MYCACKLNDIRFIVNNSIGKLCPYCGVAGCVTNFSPDHAEPTSRGGRHCLDNMIVCCERCNQTKGPLSAQAFQALLDFLRASDFFVACELAENFVNRPRVSEFA